MTGPISQTSGASGIFARPINLAGAANGMRLMKIANRSDDGARCGLSNAPTPEFQSGLGKAMRACCDVIQQEYVDAGSKDKVKFEKAMEWLEGQGAGELGPKVLNEMTALGASYAALRHLCDATPADELHIQWKDQIQGAIVSAARRIGACKTPPSGDYMGDAKSEAVADALKEAGDRLVKCFKEVGGQTLVEATVASLLAEPMYLAIKNHHGERVASEFVEGGVCQRRIEQVLHKQELSNVEDAVRDQLALKTFAGVQGAVEAVLKLPALVVDPQTAKDAPKAPAAKENPLPRITPELRDLAKSGSGINIAQNINNFDDMANAIRETGNSADLVNAIVNAFKEGFAMGQKEGRLGERLTHIENRNSELEKQNRALRDQLRARSHSPDHGFWSENTVLSEDAQSGIYDNPDSRLRADEPAVRQANGVFNEGALLPDQGITSSHGVIRDEVGDDDTVTHVDDSAFEALRNVLNDIDTVAGREPMDHVSRAHEDPYFAELDGDVSYLHAVPARPAGDARPKHDERNATSSNTVLEEPAVEPRLSVLEAKAKFESLISQQGELDNISRARVGRELDEGAASVQNRPSQQGPIATFDQYLEVLRKGPSGRTADGENERFVKASTLVLGDDGALREVRDRVVAEKHVLDGNAQLLPSDLQAYLGRRPRSEDRADEATPDAAKHQTSNFASAKAALDNPSASKGTSVSVAQRIALFNGGAAGSPVVRNTFGKAFQRIQAELEQRDVQVAIDQQQGTMSTPVRPGAVSEVAVRDKPLTWPDARSRSLMDSTFLTRESISHGVAKGKIRGDVASLIMRGIENMAGTQQKRTTLNSRGGSLASTDTSSLEESDREAPVYFATSRFKGHGSENFNEFGIPLVGTVTPP